MRGAIVMKYILAVSILALCAPPPAFALQQPHPTKKDSRIWEVNYAPDDITEIWGAPGTTLVIKLGPDEEVKKIKGSDPKRLLPSWSDNIVTLKFRGCLIQQPFFIFSLKGDEVRTYAFQIETKPLKCEDPDHPAPTLPNMVNASYSNPDQPDLSHLAHEDDLAPGGPIPYMLKINYPHDASAKRQADERAASKIRQKREAEARVAPGAAGTGTGIINKYYWGRGDLHLEPADQWDDGYTTHLNFPGNTAIPIATKPARPDQHCGPSAEEGRVDFSVTDGTMTIPGTAQAYCLRHGASVYELWNAGYTQAGHLVGTGTVSPEVERVVKGQGDGNSRTQ
jgi:type IV secretion system protein VirB9